MNIKRNIKVLLMVLATVTATGSLTSCSDEPDSEYFYTFTGEMLSDYLNNREQYSDFKTIVERADLMDLLSTYGQYTCFLPDNKAVGTYLKSRGMNSVADLTDADCDTIARTHLVSNMYSTFEMVQDFLPTYNLQGRYLSTKQVEDENGNAVVQLEGTAYIIFSDTLENGTIIHQNDSVENGIVQPINMVIEKSNCYAVDILRDNDKISLFYEALMKTGVNQQIELIEDATYSKNQPKYYYKSHTWKEVAWVPDTKKYGFTAFIEPDSLYRAKFQELGIDTSQGELHALYDLAASLYYDTYGSPETFNDAAKEGWKFENLTDSINPLKRFIQYHIMNRYVPGTANLTSMVIKETKGAFGYRFQLVNPMDWYTTLLPRTMLKVTQLTMNKDEQKRDCRGVDRDKVGRHFINRRYGETSDYTIRGALIDNEVESEYEHDALNGHYFYVDDIIAFTADVRDKVQNMRIRMDFSAVFPEVMTNDMRQKGNYMVDDSNSTPDDSNEPKNGKNYYFPDGYLDGVTINNDGKLVMRRPHINFWSWQGDEWNLFGDYDMTFRIPPVPFSGEWQLRLGFCSIPTRGVMQVYFDGVPQGIPLDMTKDLNTEMYLGDRWTDYDGYMKKTDEERAEEQKVLKNLGAYRDGRSQMTGTNTESSAMSATGMYRRILCQTDIDATKDHYIRFRVASDGKGNNNEFMLDFFEMVPKSVYAVDSDDAMEDDL